MLVKAFLTDGSRSPCGRVGRADRQDRRSAPHRVDDPRNRSDPLAGHRPLTASAHRRGARLAGRLGPCPRRGLADDRRRTRHQSTGRVPTIRHAGRPENGEDHGTPLAAGGRRTSRPAARSDRRPPLGRSGRRLRPCAGRESRAAGSGRRLRPTDRDRRRAGDSGPTRCRRYGRGHRGRDRPAPRGRRLPRPGQLRCGRQGRRAVVPAGRPLAAGSAPTAWRSEMAKEKSDPDGALARRRGQKFRTGCAGQA